MSEELEIVSNEEEEGIEIDIPMPLNSFPITTTNNTIPYNNNNDNNMMKGTIPYNNSKAVTIRYKECLKNHAASIGGHVIDGCGEFMPATSNGSSSNNSNEGHDVALGQFICSACKCHRNFHCKVIEAVDDDQFILPNYHPHHQKVHNNNTSTTTTAAAAATATALGYPTTTTLSTKPHQMIVPCKTVKSGTVSLPSQCDEQLQEYIGGGDREVSRKRFRTKFSQEQKEKMSGFAERIGWRLQKEDECAVQEFCEEIGVKRKVFKVWMHNNKHNLAKNLININIDYTTGA